MAVENKEPLSFVDKPEARELNLSLANVDEAKLSQLDEISAAFIEQYGDYYGWTDSHLLVEDETVFLKIKATASETSMHELASQFSELLKQSQLQPHEGERKYHLSAPAAAVEAYAKLKS